MIASCPRQADPSGLYLSQVHSSFSNNGSPSACHEQLCSCKCEFCVHLKHRIFCGPSLLRHSYDCPLDRTSASEEPLPSPGTVWMTIAWCCLTTAMYSCLYSVLGLWELHWSILPHICITGHLSFDTLELWEPDAAPSWETLAISSKF